MTLFHNLLACLLRTLYYWAGFVRASLLDIRLGAGARVSPFAQLQGVAYIGTATIGRDVHMGRASYINSGVIVSARIGKWCSLGYNVLIGPTEHDYGMASTSPHFPYNKTLEAHNVRTRLPPPVLEDDVWIGANVVVLRGVTIGRGAVIGAGAVVTKDIPEYSIATGIPARVVRRRFKDESSTVAAARLLEQTGGGRELPTR